ncbi:MAG: succinylglutamate desuccinylase/aspartoacylase family protein [Deltaproteobacteria bacterium]|nr:succinylglutamate desuccinylase/aspartoacylase family protein [Deltaproteobacteria bacterium]
MYFLTLIHIMFITQTVETVDVKATHPVCSSTSFWSTQKGVAGKRVFRGKWRAITGLDECVLKGVMPRASTDELTKLGFSVEVVEKQSFKLDGDYETLDSIYEILNNFAQNYSSTTLHVVGFSSTMGYPIWALHINKTGEKLPAIRITGAHHGNEQISVENALGITREILTSTSAVYDEFDFWIVPVVNPEGYKSDTRFTAHGIDLNRDYGCGWDENQSDFPYSENETRAMYSFSSKISFVAALDYHSTAEYVNALFDYTPWHSEDDTLIMELSSVYGDVANLVPTRGFDWYQANGTSQDTLYSSLGIFAWTIETLMPANPDSTVEENIQAFESFLMEIQPLIGCGQLITPSGNTAKAQIFLDGNRQPSYSTDNGFFCRILPDETVNVTVASPPWGETSSGLTRGTITDFEIDGNYTNSGVFRIQEFGLNYPYNNFSVPNWSYSVFGDEDGETFSLCGGFITLDFAYQILDDNGDEFLIHEDGSDGEETAEIYLSKNMNGPWIYATQCTGDCSVDIGSTELTSARFMRIVDLTSPGNNPKTGYDIDSIEVTGGVDLSDADNDGQSAWEDCDDNDDEVGFGFPELCDGKDNNCNSFTDEDFELNSDGTTDCTPSDASTPDGSDSSPDSSDTDEIDSGDNNSSSTDGCKCSFNPDNSSFPSLMFFLFTGLIFLMRRFS